MASRDKVRIRFRKAGDLRLVSHHDLMRCFERMLRRAAVPFHSTAGFNPKPRLVFALSLGLGIVGCQEVVELELDAPVPLDELVGRLREQAPAGLEILEARRIDPKTTAHVRRVTYRIAAHPSAGAVAGLSEAGRNVPLPQRVAALLAQSELWVQRPRSPRRRMNIRPYIDALRVQDDALEMDLWVTPNGTARPDELLMLLGLGDLLAEGGVLERIRLELEDEAGPALVAMPPSDSPQETHETEFQSRAPSGGKVAAGDQGPHPLIPGPLDY